MNNNLVEIVAVLDRSYSMSSIKDAAQESFDGFINEQKALDKEVRVTLAQFDDQYELVYEQKPIQEVPNVELLPRGSTALLDAIGKTANTVGERLHKTPEDQRPSRVIFVIVTDGQENQSKEFKLDDIKKIIQTQEDVYKWDFVYLSADANAFHDATVMGFKAGKILQYDHTQVGVSGAYCGMSASVVRGINSGKEIELESNEI